MISCFFQYPVEGVSGDLIKGTELSNVQGENKITYNVCISYKFDAVVCIASTEQGEILQSFFGST